MNREILIACLPCFVVLCAATVVLRVVLAWGSGDWEWRKLSKLHSCEEGGVQSLAFVLTMPLFIMILLLIVQVSQLMVAQMVIHYAAFAGARAASVWLPSAVEDPTTELDDLAEVENRLNELPHRGDGDYSTYDVYSNTTSVKLWKVRSAVIQAIAPLCPSRDLGVQGRMGHLSEIAAASETMYATLAPRSQSNARIPVRIANKLNYADANTRVLLEWRDGRDSNGRDSYDNTSYNVRNHICPTPEWQTHFRPNEMGWQDPITVWVTHDFALIPGPGRFLAKYLVRANGEPDRVAPRIRIQTLNASRKVYTTQIRASATIASEGLKSVKPVWQPVYALPSRSSTN